MDGAIGVPENAVTKVPFPAFYEIDSAPTPGGGGIVQRLECNRCRGGTDCGQTTLDNEFTSWEMGVLGQLAGETGRRQKPYGTSRPDRQMRIRTESDIAGEMDLTIPGEVAV